MKGISDTKMDVPRRFFNTVTILLIAVLNMIFTNSDPNCTYEMGNIIDRYCPADIKVNWWSIAPYVYIDETQTGSNAEPMLIGTMKEIIEYTIRKCCGECVSFTYISQFGNANELKYNIGRNSSVLNFPMYGKSSDVKYSSYPYFPIIEAPGIIYIQPVPESGTSANAVFDAAFSGWPVLVLSVIMASLAGIVMWALDTYWNPDEFPRSAVSGFWQGFWWAFVSMTTVGYGDKAPKSFIARVFAFFWILIGLVIIGIFTGTVTTALTTLSLTNDVSLFSKTVVVYNHSEEQTYASNERGNAYTVTNINDFADIIKSKKVGDVDIAGGLIDSYVAGFYEEKLSRSVGLKVAAVEDHQFAYGLVLSNDLNNIDTPRCVRQQLSMDEAWIVQRIQKTMKSLPDNVTEDKSSDMFDASSVIFQSAVYYCLGISALLTLCGIAWEYLYYRPKLAKETQKEGGPVGREIEYNMSFEDLLASQCHEVEEMMLKEVMDLYTEFSKKMEEISHLHQQQDPNKSHDLTHKIVLVQP